MYQATITTFTGAPVLFDVHFQEVKTYENLSSLGVNFVDTEYIACKFIGRNTNYTRTINFKSGDDYPYPKMNNRYWELEFNILATGNDGVTIVDTEANRRQGYVFLKSPEIYEMTWYINPTYSDLDSDNWTPIGLTTILNLKRTIDDPYVSAPVVEYTEYTTNDVSSSTTNTNIQYGTQTG